MRGTSADRGHTYQKLLCITFDLVVLQAHLEEKFQRFVYYDGLFESSDVASRLTTRPLMEQMRVGSAPVFDRLVRGFAFER